MSKSSETVKYPDGRVELKPEAFEEISASPLFNRDLAPVKVADRIGRKRALMLSILTYSLCSFASGLATSIFVLACFRFILGLGMGGEWNTGATLVAETWPTELRAKAISIVQSSWAIGYALAALVAGIVLHYANWRMVFFVGILPALVILWIRKDVPESEMWLEHHRLAQDSKRVAAAQASYDHSSFVRIFQPRHVHREAAQDRPRPVDVVDAPAPVPGAVGVLAPAQEEKIKVGLLMINADAGVFVALEKGYFKEQILPIELKTRKEAPDGVALQDLCRDEAGGEKERAGQQAQEHADGQRPTAANDRGDEQHDPDEDHQSGHDPCGATMDVAGITFPCRCTSSPASVRTTTTTRIEHGDDLVADLAAALDAAAPVSES